MSLENPELVGNWNLAPQDFKVGKFLFFLTELAVLRKIYRCASTTINIQKTYPHDQFNLLKNLIGFYPYTVLSSQDFNENRSHKKIVWPEDFLQNQTLRPDEFSFVDSSLWLQFSLEKYQLQSLPALKPSLSLAKRAKDWISRNLGNSPFFCVHMKHNPQDKQSNADASSWEKFLVSVAAMDPNVKVLGLGSDAYPSEFEELPNFIKTQSHESDFVLDLSLICQSAFFMGMSSGPCNMAILSHLPCGIWKHPGHHTEEMQKEFLPFGNFNFLQKDQKFKIAFDTFEELQNEYVRLRKVSGWK